MDIMANDRVRQMSAESLDTLLDADSEDERLLMRDAIKAAVRPGYLFSILRERREKGKKNCPLDYLNAAEIEAVKAAGYLVVAYSTFGPLLDYASRLGY